MLSIARIGDRPHPDDLEARGGRKVIVGTAATAWATARLRPDETMIRAPARAHRWKRMLEDGKYRWSGGLAEAEGEAIWRAARETIDAWKS